MADEPAPSAPAPPAPAPVPATPQPPVPATATMTVSPPTTVAVPLDQLTGLLALPAKLAEHESRWAELDRKAKEDVTAAMLKAGQAEEAVKTVRQQWQDEATTLKTEKAALEVRAKTFARDTALAEALAAHPLVPGSAPQLKVLLRDGLQAVAEGDAFAVRTATFQTAADFVKEQLGRPEFAHFLAPATAGGVPPGNTHRADPAKPEPQGDPVMASLAKLVNRGRGNGVGLGGENAAQATNRN